MNKLYTLLAIIILSLPVTGQNLIVEKAANLQVYVVKNDGMELRAETRDLDITYEPGFIVTSVFDPSTFTSDDDLVNEMIDQITPQNITFTTTIPAEEFTFTSNIDAELTSQAQLVVNSDTTIFFIHFTISNMNTTDENNFMVIGDGHLPVRAVGLTEEEGFAEDIVFEFEQQVTLTSP
jgi:hypothetical protein